MTTLPKLTNYQRAQVLTKLGVKHAKGLADYRFNHPQQAKRLRDGDKRDPNEWHSTKPKGVLCLDTNVTYKSITSAARANNIAPSNLCAHLKGRVPHCAGLRFKYV